MADFPGALDIPTDHRDGFGVPFAPRYIIVHGTAGGASAQDIAHYFQVDNPPSSTHYVIGQDGTIVQCVPETSAAWGNGVLSAGHDAWWSEAVNPNTISFSIEHVKSSTDNSDALTPAQQAASFRLIAHLCVAHGIPARAADAAGGITGHYSIDPVNRARCPGPYPWDALYSYLNAGSGGGTPVSDVASNYTVHEDATGRKTYTDNRTGQSIGQGVYDYIVREGITQSCLHGEERIRAGADDMFAIFGDASGDRLVVWDATRQACTESWGGHVALALLERLSAAEAQIAALKQQLAASPTPQPTPTPAPALTKADVESAVLDALAKVAAQFETLK